MILLGVVTVYEVTQFMSTLDLSPERAGGGASTHTPVIDGMMVGAGGGVDGHTPQPPPATRDAQP